ncbi:MAG: DUF998 domain-containing protein [Candidatus Thermoplasmatota archaeon]
MLRPSYLVIGLILSIMSAQFLLVLMLGAAIAPDYSIHDNAISDLGVIAQTTLLFNTSLFLFGLFIIIAAYFYHPLHKKRSITLLFIIAGIGGIGVAFFPLNNPVIHSIFALIAFLFTNLLPIGISVLLPKPLNVLSIVIGTLGLVFLLLHFLSGIGVLNVYGVIGHGGSERMIVYPVLLWFIAFGGYLMASSEKKMVTSS